MVPSWTETLLWAGVPVVGRTRFCLHPADQVTNIPIVGGTKNWNLNKVRDCQPDLLVLDKEENPQWMAEEPDLPYWASHVVGVESMPSAMKQSAKALNNSRLTELSERWERVLQTRAEFAPDQIPGVVEWGRRPERSVSSVVYVIWRDPWMAVGPQTFIGTMLSRLGLKVHPFEQSYPEFDPKTLPKDSLLLFSSEPYPFMRKRESLHKLDRPYAFVDGEVFSWFGVRSLRFLESVLTHT